MKKKSIIFTVNLTFIISFILISASFIFLYNVHQKRESYFVYKRSMEITRMFLDEYRDHGVTKKLIRDLEGFNFSLIVDEKKIKNILDSKNLKIKHVKKNRHVEFYSLKLNGTSLTYVKAKKFRAILEDKMPISNDKSMPVLIYLVIVAVFFFLYFSIINKLRPLKELNKVVENFGNEEFDFEFSSLNEDEISKLMNEFAASAQKLKKLKESRNIFIRNIMHELKTPITKGKILIHLPKTEENIETMQKVFYRLEALINEFAAIEELISTKKELQKQEYHLEDIVDNSADILMCDEEEVIKEFENIKLSVDFDIFSIAVKNLLDNGIKYSKDKRVSVKSDGRKIIFENAGEKLKYPLESYFEPFFRGDDVKSNQSFGLGLYIVKHILDAHGMELKYEHQNNINRFIIV